MRIAVTGSSGYIGSHLVARLITEGHEVACYDLATGQDITKRDFTLAPCDVVVHLAALIDARASQADPFAYFDTNVAGTLAVLRAMRDADCHHLVFASTAVAAAPDSSPYAASKRMVENVLYTLNCEGYAFTFLGLRLFNVCGGAERHNPETHLIPRAIEAALCGTPLTIYGDGLSTRDYIHVADVVEAIVASIRNVRQYPLNGVMDIGTGIQTSALDIIKMVEAATGRAIEVVHAQAVREPRELLANPAQARVILNWRHSRSVSDAIAGTVADAKHLLDIPPKVLQFRTGAPTAP